MRTMHAPGSRTVRLLVCLIFGWGFSQPVATAQAEEAAATTRVDFDRDIRPILSENCFLCHGPSASSRAADLRLDTQAGLFEIRGETAVVQPGKPDSSELIRRIQATDTDELMPPPDSKLKLTQQQIILLRNWVEAGAPWSGHWAFTNPVAPEIPDRELTSSNPIDVLVRKELLARNLRPAPPASREELLRRVKFDLTGLPPTIEELDQFLADDSPGAYEALVDRFLASPHYGERMAWTWLDVARYADTNGYQGDRERTMWPWRDWVIRAYNENLPYDQFTIKQLAGDLLPQASRDDLLATGFCRNHMINGEGGRIAEENRVEYVFDQTETMGTVWLGLTLTCSRCHDHKYDPLTQREYYQFFDFFNQTPVNGAGGDPRMPPNLEVPSPAQEQQLANFSEQIQQARNKIKAREQQLNSELESWLAAKKNELLPSSKWVPLVPQTARAEHQTLTIQPGHAVLVGGPNPDQDRYEIEAIPDATPDQASPAIASLRLDALRHATMTAGGLARSDSGNFVLTEIRVEAVSPDGTARPVDIVSAQATHEQGNLKITNAFDADPRSGWAVLQGKFVDRDHAAVFRFREPVAWTPGMRFRIHLNFESPHRHHNLGYFLLSVSADRDAPLDEAALPLLQALRTPAESRTQDQLQLLQQRQRQDDPLHRQVTGELAELEKSRNALKQQVPVVMIMRDQDQRRATYLLEKGLYNKPGAEARASLPDWLPAASTALSERPNRLDLARWLVDPHNPLTARVSVNRVWQMFFGTGLVKTAEDFGSQGTKPTHPALLDWLAVQFVNSGWDMKQLHKVIVMSETYRQTARVSPELYENDPENIWLARGPRSRLPSWMIRDQALAVSGLLVPELGGPPVNPYQPEGIWAEATFGKIKYVQDHGDKLYRRTLYTFWRRIVGPTMLFDNSPRQTCSVLDYRTNTPLHALVTLNDITYVEAARVLAARVLREQTDTQSRLELAMRLVTSRRPSPEEFRILEGRLQQLQHDYAAHPEEAEAVLQIGEYRDPAPLDRTDHAAWTGLCTLLLNLDEAISH